MNENTNRAIAINSIILYFKLAIITVTGLLTTRFALQALGVNDFGLFSVIGSIISFITIFNTIMVATSNRFISVALGKGNNEVVNEQFNLCFLIHVVIAIFTLLIFIPLGDYYIKNYLNYTGDISTAVDVFRFSVIGSVISFIGVPYNGLLVAKEKFLVFSLTDTIAHIVKMAVAFTLIYFFQQKLLIYAITQGLLTAVPTLLYGLYCQSKYPDIVKFKLSFDQSKYRAVLSFSGWVAYGAVATVGKNQGAQIIVNTFFTTLLNTALGLANTVGMFLTSFANSISQPIAPQITKNYAAGDINRCNELLIMSTKYTYLLTLCISLPFLACADWILGLWLGNVPEYVVLFTVLILIDTLVTAFNSGISNIIFASGKIKLYQISINTIRLLSIFVAYFALKYGLPAQALLWTYILFSIVIFFVSQIVLSRTIGFDNRLLWKQSYVPSFQISALLTPVFLVPFSIHPSFVILISELYFIILVYGFGLSKKEKQYIDGKVNAIFNKISQK